MGFTEEPFYEDADASDPDRAQGLLRPPRGLTMRIACWAALAAVPAGAAGRGSGRRADHALHSDIDVQPDGSLDVTETIDVRAEQSHQPRHLPRFPDPLPRPQWIAGARRLHPARRHARWPCPSRRRSSPSQRRADSHRRREKTVEPGDHRYVIRYRTTRQIGRFAEFDELYWNATGNGWVFPIDVAEAHCPPARARCSSASAPSTPGQKARLHATPRWSRNSRADPRSAPRAAWALTKG